MTVSTVTRDDPSLLLEQFLTGYWSVRTRANYRFIIGGWFAWCAVDGHDPVREADPRVIERWITGMQHRPYAANTIAARVSAVSAFYCWCVREQVCNRNPVEAVRRPSRPSESATASLTRRLACRRRTAWRRLVGRSDAARTQRVALRGADRL